MIGKYLEDLMRATANSEGSSTTSRPEPDLELLKTHQINEQQFQEAFASLLKKWWDNDNAVSDCEGKRFVQSVLLKDLKNPLNLSIIADDLEAFKRLYPKKENERNLIFELCCVCGAEKIITNYFLKEQEQIGKHCLVHCDNAIAYVLSSGKTEFALTLAKKAKELGRKEPGPIALYSLDWNTLAFSKKVQDVFFPQAPLDLAESQSKTSASFTPHRQKTRLSQDEKDKTHAPQKNGVLKKQKNSHPENSEPTRGKRADKK